MVMMAARLNAGQNRVLAFARSAVAQGISANESLRQLSAAGAGIRRIDYLEVYRYAANVFKSGNVISSIRKDYFPSPESIPDSKTDIRRNYSFNVRLDLKRTDTGKTFEKNITVSVDRLISPGAIEGEAYDAFYDPDSGREDTNVEILAAVIVESRAKAEYFFQ